MRLKDLLEQRARAVASMREINDHPNGEGGDLSADQESRFSELKGELAALETKIERQRLLDEADRRMQGEPVSGSGDEPFDEELRNFSLVRAIASQVPELNVDGGREREIGQEVARRMGVRARGIMVPTQVFEQRVTTTTAPAAGPGSNLVKTDHFGNQFIDRLRAALVTRRLGAKVLNGLVGDVDIPKLKESAVAAWVAENEGLSTSDLQFTKCNMTPKHAGALTELSRNMLIQTSPDIEALVRDDFARTLAAAVDSVAIMGGGANEPTGILQTAGIGDVAVGENGGAIEMDHLADLIGTVEDEDVEGATAFLTNTKVKRQAMKIKDADGVPMGLDRVFYNLPRAFSNLVPSNLTKGTAVETCSPLIYGKWDDLLLGYWSAFEILVNPYASTAYSKGNVQVRGMLTMDVAVRHAESFAAIQDIVTG